MTIIIQWIDTQGDLQYSEEMRVISSTHPRFTIGSRFDFGFFNIATKEGYTIISLPIKS